MADHDARDRDRLGTLLELTGRRPSVPAERMERARSEARAVWQAQVTARRARRQRIVAGAMTAAAMLLVAFVWFVRQPSPSSVAIASVERVSAAANASVLQGDLVHSDDWFTTSDALRASLRLESGHSLRIDRNTRLRFVSATALELEQGAVYVDSDTSLPGGSPSISIRTPYGTIREIGTRYEVRLGTDDRGAPLSVRVRDGSVVLEGREQRVNLDAAERVDLVDGVFQRGAIRPDDPSWDWSRDVAPRIDLDGRTLSEFLSDSAREFGVELRFVDAALEQESRGIQISGSIAELTLEEAVQSVLATCDMAHRLEPGSLVVFRPE